MQLILINLPIILIVLLKKKIYGPFEMNNVKNGDYYIKIGSPLKAPAVFHPSGFLIKIKNL